MTKYETTLRPAHPSRDTAISHSNCMQYRTWRGDHREYHGTRWSAQRGASRRGLLQLRSGDVCWRISCRHDLSTILFPGANWTCSWTMHTHICEYSSRRSDVADWIHFYESAFALQCVAFVFRIGPCIRNQSAGAPVAISGISATATKLGQSPRDIPRHWDRLISRIRDDDPDFPKAAFNSLRDTSVENRTP